MICHHYFSLKLICAYFSQHFGHGKTDYLPMAKIWAFTLAGGLREIPHVVMNPGIQLVKDFQRSGISGLTSIEMGQPPKKHASPSAAKQGTLGRYQTVNSNAFSF
jgi:hypothetical protein